MKYLFFILFILPSLKSITQGSISSTVFKGQKPGVIFKGEATVIKDVKFELIHLSGNKEYKKTFSGREGVVFIKNGKANFQSASFMQELTPGSIALISQGQELILKTVDKLEFYLFSYQAKSILPYNDTCTSFTKIWEDLVFNPHDRGGVRSYFSRPTSQTKRFEMHVTTLLGGLPSHPPHTHPAEEIILMIEGETEMEIGGKNFRGVAGDVYFIKSLEAHGIKNIGKNSCSYFAFQWE